MRRSSSSVAYCSLLCPEACRARYDEDPKRPDDWYWIIQFARFTELLRTVQYEYFRPGTESKYVQSSYSTVG